MAYRPTTNCPWRKPPKHPLDGAEKLAHVVCGMMLGAFASSFLVIESFFTVAVSESGSMWIPATILIAAVVVCGILGGVYGHRFIDWMSENWSRFGRNHFHG